MLLLPGLQLFTAPPRRAAACTEGICPIAWGSAALLPRGDAGRRGSVLAASVAWCEPWLLQGQLGGCARGEAAPRDPPGTPRLLPGGGDGFEGETFSPRPRVAERDEGVKLCLPALGNGAALPRVGAVSPVCPTSGARPRGVGDSDSSSSTERSCLFAQGACCTRRDVSGAGVPCV